MSYGTTISIDTPFSTTLERVRKELQDEGFGILTEINVTATMAEKLDASIENYVILGACNPPLAYQALDIDRSIGMLLPCNVVVRSAADDTTIVEILDPQLMATLSGLNELRGPADDASARLGRVIERLHA
ncbi:MAG: DUF302 domain-containing protein [Microbacterium sp.]